MSKHRNNKQRESRRSTHQSPERSSLTESDTRPRYELACRCVVEGEVEKAQRIYQRLKSDRSDRSLAALAHNDLATLGARNGDFLAAMEGFRQALAIDPQCQPAHFNLTLLENALV